MIEALDLTKLYEATPAATGTDGGEYSTGVVAAVGVSNNSSPTTLGGMPTASGGSGSYIYSWTPTASLNSTGTANPTATPTATTTYHVIVTDANDSLCYSQDSLTITLAGLTVNAGPDHTICNGTSVQLGGNPTASGVSSIYIYFWTPSNGLNSSIPPNPNASPNDTTIYRLAVIDGFGCHTEDTTIVYVVENQVAEAGLDQHLCDDTITLLGATAPAYGNGHWSVLSGNAIFADTTQPGSLISELVPDDTTILLWTVVNGPCEAVDGMTIITTRINDTLYWTGSFDTVWNEVANWHCPRLPDTSLHVIIPPFPVNEPNLLAADTGYAKTVTVQNGAALYIRSQAMLQILEQLKADSGSVVKVYNPSDSVGIRLGQP